MFYEQQKQDKINAHNAELKKHKEEMARQEEENKKNMQTIEQHLDDDDPWLERQRSISGKSNEKDSTSS